MRTAKTTLNALATEFAILANVTAMLDGRQRVENSATEKKRVPMIAMGMVNATMKHVFVPLVGRALNVNTMRRVKTNARVTGCVF